MQLPKVWERLLVVAVALLVPLCAAAQADADDVADDPFGPSEALFDEGVKEPDWIPSLRLDIGIVHHQGFGMLTTPSVDADRDGIDLNGPGSNECPSATPNPTILHPECPGIVTVANRREILVGTSRTAVDGATLGVSFELLGPPIEELIGDMRVLFVGGFRDMLEGNTAVVRAQGQTPQANRVRAKGKFLIDKMYYAGIGSSFQLPVEGYNVKFKPSINWVMAESQVTPFLVQQVLVSSSATGTNNDFPRQNEVGLTNQGIAPRVELDAEVYRQGPISVGVFASFEVQYFLSGPLTHSERVTSCLNHGDDLPVPCANVPKQGPNDPPTTDHQGTLQFDYDRDPLLYYGAVGLRMSWMGGP